MIQIKLIYKNKDFLFKFYSILSSFKESLVESFVFPKWVKIIFSAT